MHALLKRGDVWIFQASNVRYYMLPGSPCHGSDELTNYSTRSPDLVLVDFSLPLHSIHPWLSNYDLLTNETSSVRWF